MFELGQTVRTPDDRVGRIAALNDGAKFRFMKLSARELNIAVYAVMHDDGEVRYFRGDVLTSHPEEGDDLS